MAQRRVVGRKRYIYKDNTHHFVSLDEPVGAWSYCTNYRRQD